MKCFDDEIDNEIFLQIVYLSGVFDDRYFQQYCFFSAVSAKVFLCGLY